MKPFLTILPLLLCIYTFGQPIPDSTLKKIDHLFEYWDHPYSPGCAVGIIRNDSLIFGKGYGMANLEYDIPITPATIFHMASVSKQFTAFSIVLLARQGRLRLDDDIHKYLPWFPDLKEKITIRHLLNHTSGIRDQWQLLAIAGTTLNDVITQDQIIKLLSRQQALNFKPGEEYSYSNSGFTMLAEIVRSVTGQTLRQFTDSAIFRPLGMNDTHFHDDCTEIVKGRSYSYDKVDNTHFTNSILSYSNAGATSLFTNLNDLSKWVMNFYDHKVGDQQDIDQLTQKGRLNNGKEIDYALGIGIIDQKGWKGFAHSGADAGYRTILAVFPDMKLGFLVFSNLGDFNPANKAMAMADLFLTDKTNSPPKVKAETQDSSHAALKNPASLEKFLGDYVSDEEGKRIHFRISNNKLYADGSNRTDLLVEIKDTLSLLLRPEVKVTFNIIHPGDTTVTMAFSPTEKQVYKKYRPLPPTDKTLSAYTGTYYCSELECKYAITLKDHHLTLTNIKYNDVPLTFEGTDHLFDNFWAMYHLRMIRNGKGQITGFEVNSGRLQQLRFNKL
jgi:CubicO group peptidase (beta-lactamase class C family)